jgi:hypothetical protein
VHQLLNLVQDLNALDSLHPNVRWLLEDGPTPMVASRI